MIRIALMVCALAACGGGGKKDASDPTKSTSSGDALSNKQPAPPQPAEETPMMAMRRFANEICACTTSDCARQVSDRMTKWSQEAPRKNAGKPPTKMTDAETKEATEIGTRMSECMVKAMSAGSGSP